MGPNMSQWNILVLFQSEKVRALIIFQQSHVAHSACSFYLSQYAMLMVHNETIQDVFVWWKLNYHASQSRYSTRNTVLHNITLGSQGRVGTIQHLIIINVWSHWPYKCLTALSILCVCVCTIQGIFSLLSLMLYRGLCVIKWLISHLIMVRNLFYCILLLRTNRKYASLAIV